MCQWAEIISIKKYFLKAHALFPYKLACGAWLRQGFTAIGLKSGHAVCTHEIRSNGSLYTDSQLIYSVSGSQKSLLKAVF